METKSWRCCQGHRTNRAFILPSWLIFIMVDNQVIQLSLALDVVSCGSFAFSYLRCSVRPEGDGPGLAGGEGELWGVHRVLVIYSSEDDSDLVVQKASSLRVPSKDDMIHVYGITFYTNSFCWWGGKRRLTGHGARLQWNVVCLLSFALSMLGP